ncbi:MAG: ribbon-helix-helix protein, CopG family [Coriobacteriia bacterium]|nr:ribbon-helix-helix protein, CopG family [Coriobacteriia bacterium]
MAVEKFSISLPDDLVIDIDELAVSEGLTRSGVIREAAATYVASRKSVQYERLRRERIDSALAGFEQVAASWGQDDQTSLDHLRVLRGECAEGRGGREDEHRG